MLMFDFYSAPSLFLTLVLLPSAFCHLDNNDPCERFICECDREAAMCFGKADYNERNAHLPSHRCK